MSSDLQQEWLDLAPAWIQESREGRNPTRNGLLDPPMLAACGEVAGLRILDCGCGEGRFCRMLSARGAAYVLGIDLCERMIESARTLQAHCDEYRCADAQDLGFLAAESLDLAISYLNQCDLPDFAANTREVWRVLRPGGRFIIANLHPMRSAVGHWHRGSDGSKQHVVLDHYFAEGERHWKILGTQITNFHRTLATTLRTFLSAGFTLEDLIEPCIDPQSLHAWPELADELRVPNFIIYVLRK